MKSHRMLILSLCFCTAAMAQTDLTGTWQGKLAISPNEKMTVQFIITKQADGSYAALLNSLDLGGIRNVPATGIQLAGNVLTIDVASLNGSYSGTVGKGVITGEWRQPGSTVALVLTPYTIPPVSSLKPLVGDWTGELPPELGAGRVTAVFHFEISEDGKFNASASIPEQGQSGIPVSDVVLERDEVTFRIAGGAADYAGKRIGDKIEGALKQGAQEVKLNLTKGKYEVPGYGIPAEGIQRLEGEWSGNIGPNRLAIVFRFESTPSGKLAVFMDVPIQNVKGVIARDFTLKGDEIAIKLPGASGDSYTGRISGSSMKGIFKLNNIDQELNLVRTKYEIGTDEMSAQEMKRLLGQWVGKYAPGATAYTVIWKFEKTKDGKLKATAAAPEQGPQVFPIADISLKGEQLYFRIPGTGGEYTGKLSGDSLTGTYKIGGADFSVNVTRGAKFEWTTETDIPAESMKALLGRWNGNIGQLAVVFRFERTASGNIVIFHDIPSQNVKDMRVVQASMKQSDLLLKMADGSEISLKLAGQKLEGHLKMNQTVLAVSLTKQQ